MTRIGFYAGSFDPPTLGHVELLQRALALVDKLVVGVGRNVEKRSWLDVDVRLALLREVAPAGVEVVAFEGLAVEAAADVGSRLLVRGVRGPEDVNSELTMARANRRLDPRCETILLVGSPDTAHVSSRLVREVHASGGDVTHFVPEPVAAVLAARAPRSS